MKKGPGKPAEKVTTGKPVNKNEQTRANKGKAVGNSKYETGGSNAPKNTQKGPLYGSQSAGKTVTTPAKNKANPNANPRKKMGM